MKRSRPPPTEVLVEVIGCKQAPDHESHCLTLRSWSSRLGPLLRHRATTVSHSSMLLAPAEGGIFRAPCSPFSVRPSPAKYLSAYAVPSMKKGEEESMVLLQETGKKEGNDAINRFFFYDFFSKKFQDDRIFLRPYFHESTRTASFLIADRNTRKAALIDPQLTVTEYLRDLKEYSFTLTHVCLTHYFEDIMMGHNLLLRMFPDCELVAADASSCSACTTDTSSCGRDGTAACCEDKEGRSSCFQRCCTLSPNLFLSYASTPGVSDAGGVFLLSSVKATADTSVGAGMTSSSLTAEQKGTEDATCILCAFVGTLLGTDCVGRMDGPVADVATAHQSIRNILLEEILSKRGCTYEHTQPMVETALRGSTAEAQDVQQAQLRVLQATKEKLLRLCNVVIFPSHGGYNLCTPQLDLFWAAHVSDMFRVSTNKKLFEAILDPTSQSMKEYANAQPDLPPRPFNWDLILAKNKEKTPLQEKKGTAADREKLFSLDTFLAVSPDNFRGAVLHKDCPILVDVRSQQSNLQRRVPFSVSIPMSFPASVPGAKKAELWISALLLPIQSTYILCDSGTEEEVLERFELLGFQSAAAGGCVQCILTERQIPDAYFEEVAIPRLGAYNQLSTLLEESKENVVIDCRTAFEFLNGSHRAAAHIPLADLRRILMGEYDCDACICANADATSSVCGGQQHCCEAHRAAGTTTACSTTGKGIQQLWALLAAHCHLSDCDFLNQLPELSISIYCAGGYRSHIFASFVRAALLYASSKGEGEKRSTKLPASFQDVPGGALQIMIHRPDLWQTKDRSIICIS